MYTRNCFSSIDLIVGNGSQKHLKQMYTTISVISFESKNNKGKGKGKRDTSLD